MTGLTWSDIGIIAGIIFGIAGTFAVPFGVWMAKMWNGQNMLHLYNKVQTGRLKGLSRRVGRLEDSKDAQGLTLNASLHKSHGALTDLISTTNERVSEHAQQLADHNARITAAERDIVELRDHR